MVIHNVIALIPDQSLNSELAKKIYKSFTGYFRNYSNLCTLSACVLGVKSGFLNINIFIPHSCGPNDQ